jgi:DNA-binding XRE family transcriptional regulator
MTNVATNLRLLRTMADLGQAELAARIGVSRQTVWAWERGQRAIPTDKAEELGRVFACSPATVVGWSDLFPTEEAA